MAVIARMIEIIITSKNIPANQGFFLTTGGKMSAQIDWCLKCSRNILEILELCIAYFDPNVSSFMCSSTY